MKRVLSIWFLIIFCFPNSIFSQNLKASLIYQAQPKDVVWSFLVMPGDQLLIAHRAGKLVLHDLKNKKEKIYELPPILVSGQGGLLDLVWHQGELFYSYSTPSASGHTLAIGKGKFDGRNLHAIREIFKATIQTGDLTHHFGGRLLIEQNTLYVTIGDRGHKELAQDMNFHNGKVLRMNLEGQAVEIFTSGHRNPQGIDVNPVSGKIYSAEFGPKGGDEINLLVKGKNYGWPLVTHGTDYDGKVIGPISLPQFEKPLFYWTPSISPSDIHFYRGDRFPEWKNNLFIACLSSQHLRRLVVENDQVMAQEELFLDLRERIRSVTTGADGGLYFSTDSGKIYRVER